MKQLLMALALGVSMASNFPQVIGQMYEPFDDVALHLSLPPACETLLNQTDANRRRSPRRERLFDGRCVVVESFIVSRRCLRL